MLKRLVLCVFVVWNVSSSSAACRNKTSCACEYDCPTTSDWLCGDDGVSYINRCELNRMECETQQVIGVSDTGRCTQNSLDPCDSVVCGVGMRCKVDKRLEQPDCVCSNLCSANASEVCGSDGITYTNVCYMRALSCKRGDDVKMKKRGPCEVEPINPCLTKKCPAGVCRLSFGRAQCICWYANCVNIGDICGTDHKTYPSFCHLKAQSCKTKMNIHKAYPGRCLTNDELCEAARCRDACRVQGGKVHCYCKDNCQTKTGRVCGDDGETYRSQCHMELMACRLNTTIKIAPKGGCSSDSCLGINCGPGRHCVSSGSAALCQCDSHCPISDLPLCAANNVTYKSKCHLDYASCRSGVRLRIAHRGSCNHCRNANCAERQKCVERNGRAWCICTRDGCERNPPQEKAVCGTDGKSYLSECLLKYEKCRSGKHVSVLYNGNCSEECDCLFGASCVIKDRQRTCQCTFNCTQSPLSPVCVTGGEDGRNNNTYPNNCTVLRTACENQTELIALHDGPCQAVCDTVRCGYGEECIVKKRRPRCVCQRICSKTVQKVCGTDGKTYPNNCVLAAKACRRASNVTVAHAGACKPLPVDPCEKVNCSGHQRCVAYSNNTALCVCLDVCSSAGIPVCGTDGQTYTNRCLLELEACRDGKPLSVLRDGDCLSPNATEADECKRCETESMTSSRRKACSPDVFVARAWVSDRLAVNLSSLMSRYRVIVDRVFRQPLTGNIGRGAHVLQMKGLVHDCHCPLDSRVLSKFTVGGRVEATSGELIVDRDSFVRQSSGPEDALWQLATGGQRSDPLCS